MPRSRPSLAEMKAADQIENVKARMLAAAALLEKASCELLLLLSELDELPEVRRTRGAPDLGELPWLRGCISSVLHDVDLDDADTALREDVYNSERNRRIWIETAQRDEARRKARAAQGKRPELRAVAAAS